MKRTFISLLVLLLAIPLAAQQPRPGQQQAAQDDQSDRPRIDVESYAVDVTLAPRLTLSGETAYLPYVRFTGSDDHVLRELLSPESGNGVGVQLEATLSYAFSLCVGGRWAMRTTSGDVNFGGEGVIVPMRYAAEQAQVLVQGTYKFSGNRK